MRAMSMDCASMPGMAGGPWPAAASFLGMWIVMMAVMMLPSLVPMLRHYHGAVRRGGGGRHLVPLTLVVCAGYFAVWSAAGLVAFALTLVQREPIPVLAPLAVGIVALLAGGLQFTPWKARHLACCRETSPVVAPGIAAAWRHGLRLGGHCSCTCAGPMAVLLVAGLMDPRAMAIVTAAITVERLAPDGMQAAKAVGAVSIASGVVMIVRAAAGA